MSRELQLPSHDGVHQLHVVVWEPECPVRAVLQISHGMVEFIERYDGFAHFLNEKGIAVIGNDHLGHGQTAGNDTDLGYFCPQNMSQTVVEDLHSVTLYAKQTFPDVPYFLLGHSMGSFMARRYLMTYGCELTGAIISGTGGSSNAKLLVGKTCAAVIGACKGQRYRSPFMKSGSFSSYNKRIKPVRTPNDWLTRDAAIVDWYNGEKYCTFDFTINGYKTLFEVLTFIQKQENIDKIPKKLPILLIAGGQDPVGAYGRAVEAVYKRYKKSGIEDVNIRIYPDDRHEILNELDKDTIYADILKWLTKRCS